ncbi:MAG: hypothetical protein CMH32_01245 [Micavibrio sp.]|nr:hypothetical protein [Micavibrio sp.]HCK32513.1 hypothetical protein [Rhodospirillaceae bacterium]
MNFLELDILSLPTVAAFFIMIIVNAAVTSVTLKGIKTEVEKLEKKLDQLHTQLLKIAVLEVRLGHLEKDLNKTSARLDTIEQTIVFKV